MKRSTVNRRTNKLIKAYTNSAQYITSTGERRLSSEYERAAKMLQEATWLEVTQAWGAHDTPRAMPDCVWDLFHDQV